MSSGYVSRPTPDTRGEGYFGSSRAQRRAFVVLVSILAWMYFVLLAAVVWSMHPPFPSSAMYYGFVIAHLLPWAAGLRNLRRVRRALYEGEMEAAGAHLAYSIVLATLINTYVVLCFGETLALASGRLAGP